ncbi:uncharacterized protein BKCO1_3100057 [Diplodia corticola]|uniref:Uncharacterized protein n=1 Tax=Diplodia corticola TaxID=236234 RepID=A0A1J9S124_9PEZI|nr:uncharacterized protein BKCO1_3100057 [Diplodia corticola]OJD33365.1 hypothetical protein BKCO1_3100057 [Diplodia corticola]
MSKKDLFFGEQLPDDVVRSKFGALTSSITAWSGAFACVGPVAPAALREEHRPLYRKAMILGATGTLDSLHNAFQEKKHRKLFVRGWAAYAMCDAVFRTFQRETHPGSKALNCFGDMLSSETIRTWEDIIRGDET